LLVAKKEEDEARASLSWTGDVFVLLGEGLVDG